MKSPWLGEIVGFVVIFLAVVMVGGHRRPDCPWVDERSRAEFV